MNESRKRLAVLLRHQLFKPSEVFISEQARAMRRFRPLLLGRELSGAPTENIDYRVPSVPSAWTRWRYKLLRDPGLLEPLLKDRSPALIHAHFGVEAVYAMELAARIGVPLVTTFHGYDATMSRSKLLTSRKISWIIYALNMADLARRGDLFVCVSNFIRGRVVELGFPERLTRLHYIGVDESAFLDSEEDPDRPVVLHIARLVEKKGTSYLLEAFARLAARYPTARLVVIGDGPLKDPLLKHAEQLGIGDRVDWLGALPHAQVKHWLRRASIFCLPSVTAANGDSEGLGMVLLEASASGLPTLATNHGGIPEAVKDGVTGHLVPERSVVRLTDGLDALLGSYELRRQMGGAGRTFVRENFSMSTQTAILEEHYETLLAAH
jgi:glycosyltransferase involved in cell wall biosynthesis